MQDMHDRKNQYIILAYTGEHCIKDVEMGSEDRKRIIN